MENCVDGSPSCASASGKPGVRSVGLALVLAFSCGAAFSAAAASNPDDCAALVGSVPNGSAPNGSAAAWQDHPTAAGVQLSYLAGRPSEAGFFKYRLRFPAGFSAAAHRHSVDLHMTVLCGGVQLGLGDQPVADLGAGGYQHFPAGLVHTEASAQGAVLEITGIGPVETTPVEP